MFNFGHELIVESCRIPWLIWIQILVMFLLVALLYCFSISAFDPSDDTAATTAINSTAATASASTGQLVFDYIHEIETPFARHDSTPIVVYNGRQNTQGAENISIKGEIATGANRRIMIGGEEITERETSSLSFHPWHYFQLATVAFLKCLGLDTVSDSSSTKKRRKRKQS